MTQSAGGAADGDAAFLSEEMLQYLQVYIDESEEELESLTEAILQLERDPQHADSLNRAFRMLHSLKGSSGMLGFETVGNFAHELEDRFERWRSGSARLDRESTTLVLKAVDYFRSFLARLRVHDLHQGDPGPLLLQLQQVESGSAATAAGLLLKPAGAAEASLVQGGMKVIIRFRNGLQLADLKARLILSKLSAIGETGECDPPLDEIDSFENLTLFSLILITTHPIEEVRRIASVDGVESVEVIAGSLPAAAVVVQSAAAPAVLAGTAAGAVDVPDQAEVVAVEPVQRQIDESSGGMAVQETLRVDIGRLDQLLNLTGELVVANARCDQLLAETAPLHRRGWRQRQAVDLRENLRRRFERLRGHVQGVSGDGRVAAELFAGLDEELEALDREAEFQEANRRFFSEMSEAFDQLNRVSRGLQRSVLSTRMIPVGPLFNRFRRVVRDLSVDRGKQARLVIHGEKTELDKRMVDALGDPLLHLIRNALDHGMETPAERVAAGKPEAGTIQLSAAHRGNNVMITIQDDGGGISTEKIRQKLVQRGLVAAVQAADLSDQQLLEAIWEPGFSTASQVTEISGRGVGMDIVRSTIAELSGTIEATSEAGQGTTFTIRLPQTLAIIHCLLFRCGDGCFAVPVEDVREIVSVSAEQIHVVQNRRAIEIRGELILLAKLDEVFCWNAASGTVAVTRAAEPTLAGRNGRQEVVIVQARGRTLGLSVDSLIGRTNLVVKSLAENYTAVQGLSGAGILGDGTVCLMLDSSTVVDLTAARSGV
jgi:two-component system chemotaxis sensor kinase CheA